MATIVNPEWANELEPTLIGPAGRAWRGSKPPELADDPRWQSTVGQWLLHVPGSHPFWTWYAIPMVHLRPVEGLGPSKKQFPDAEYELLVLSLNPEHAPPNPARIGLDKAHYLMPPDHAIQFGALPGGDAKAEELLELVARSVVNGLLIPDQDHRQAWRDAIAATVDHIQEGLH